MRITVYKTERIVRIGNNQHRLRASGKDGNGDWYEFDDEPYAQVMSGMDSPPPKVVEDTTEDTQS